MRTFFLEASFSLSLAAVCSGVEPGVDLGGERDLVALRRPDRAGNVDRQLGQLAGLAAVDRQQPDLGRAAAMRDKRDRLAVVAPARVVVGAGGGCQLLGLTAGGRNEPETAVIFLGGVIELGHHVDDERAVGGDLRVGNALHGQQVFDRHGASGGKEGIGDDRHQEDCQENSHGCRS